MVEVLSRHPSQDYHSFSAVRRNMINSGVVAAEWKRKKIR